jgi:hypothetical protein
VAKRHIKRSLQDNITPRKHTYSSGKRAKIILLLNQVLSGFAYERNIAMRITKELENIAA